jgi:predicted thioredoxin/glutaredoxin
MEIRVYISCCGAEKTLAAVQQAVKQAGVAAHVEVVNDYAEIAKAGIVSTPAIQIDGRTVVSGRVPQVTDLVTSLITAASRATTA